MRYAECGIRQTKDQRPQTKDLQVVPKGLWSLVSGLWSFSRAPHPTFALIAFLSVPLISMVGCAPKQQDVSTVRIWHWMTDRDEAFNELSKRYQEQTGAKVKFELYAPSDLYAQKVRSAAQTNGLPDVFGVLGELRDVASFIRAGHVLNLSQVIADSAWQEKFFPVAIQMNAFKEGNSYGTPPGIYGVPIDVMNIQVFYNKKLLSSLGFEQPPATWDEWMAVGKQARAQGIIGFVSGWAELWMIDCFATDYAIHLMGQDKVEATFRGDVPYTDRDWVTVLQLFEQLRDSGLLAEGIVTMGNKRAEQLFANEQAVFAFNGSWGVNVYRGMNPELDYGVTMPPPVNPERKMVIWGGAGSSFMVNARSARAKPAVAFLQWLTDVPQQQYLLEATNNIPANREAAANLPPALAAFADDMDSVVHPRLFSIQENSMVIEAFDKGIQSILIGEKVPADVAQEVQELKVRERTRQASLASAKTSR